MNIDSYDRFFWLYYRLGIQSSITVGATYTSSAGGALAKTAVVAAVRAVVEAQPRLRYVCIPQRQGEVTKLQIAVLNEINVEDCIVFVDDDDGAGMDEKLLERLHNTWFDEWRADEPTAPQWKVFVKGGVHVLFSCTHAVADGISGYVFHREFLTALNDLPPSMIEQPVSPTVAQSNDQVAEAGAVKLSPTNVLPKPELLAILWHTFVSWILRVVYSKSRLNNDFPPSKPYFKDIRKIPAAEDCTQSGVTVRRIPAAELSKILAACRENGAQLTPLLLVLLIATLALDHEPNASMTTACLPYNMRPLLPMDQFEKGSSPSGAGVMMNAAGGAQRPLFLEPIRKLFPGGKVDGPALWKYVRDCKADLTQRGIEQAQKVYVAPKLFDDSLETVVKKALPSVNMAHNILVSNLGVFKPVQEGGEWSVTDVVFSASAVNGRIGCHGIVLNVAVVAGGDLVMTGAYERDVVSKDVAEKVLNGLVGRLEDVCLESPTVG